MMAEPTALRGMIDFAWTHAGYVGTTAGGWLAHKYSGLTRDAREHKKQLTLLRSELRRLSAFNRLYQTTISGQPLQPRPPEPVDLFMKTIGDVDFSITGERGHDPWQERYLAFVDHCRLLGIIQRECARILKEFGGGRVQLLKGPAYEAFVTEAARYDKGLLEVQSEIRGLLANLDDRFNELTNWRQIARALPFSLHPQARPRIEGK